MRASDLIAKAKALSPAERRKLVRSVLAMEKRGASGAKPRTLHVTWPDVEARARRVTNGRILPNLVLLAREEADF